MVDFNFIEFLKRQDLEIPTWTRFTYCDICGHIQVEEKDEWKLREWMEENNFNDLVISEQRPYGNSKLSPGRHITNENIHLIRTMFYPNKYFLLKV